MSEGKIISGQGKMEETKEGCSRESNENRGRFDLLPYEAIEALAKWYELGAKKYADRNWEKGISVKDCINRMIRHAMKAGNGWTDEDHLSAVMWNAAAAITMIARRPDCNDHPWQYDIIGEYDSMKQEIKDKGIPTKTCPQCNGEGHDEYDDVNCSLCDGLKIIPMEVEITSEFKEKLAENLKKVVTTTYGPINKKLEEVANDFILEEMNIRCPYCLSGSITYVRFNKKLEKHFCSKCNIYF